MYRIIHNANYNLPDVSEFIETLDEKSGNLFDKNADIFVTRAPGRLDVMGGIADYSGSLVLEMPIAEATLVALQTSSEPVLKIISLSETEKPSLDFEMPLANFRRDGELFEYSDGRRFFSENSNGAAYIAGVFLVLMLERGVRFERGARIFISSKVPQGKA